MFACTKIELLVINYFTTLNLQNFHFQPFFAFTYKERFEVNGWDIFDPEKEFLRQVMIYIVTIAAFYKQKCIAKEIL